MHKKGKHASSDQEEEELEADTDGDTDGESMASELRPGWSENTGLESRTGHKEGSESTFTDQKLSQT